MARLTEPGALRRLLETEPVVFAPGAYDGLTARLVEAAGFTAVCASGFAIAAGLGMPDAELYTMTENLQAVRSMARVTTVPIIADIDTGYGNAVNVMRTVREFEDAGAAAVFMEDQVAPKRCPVCVGDPVETIPLPEAVGKIRAAVDARGNPDFLIIARTDAQGQEAMDRAKAYAEAGADLIMPVSKSFTTVEEVRACHEHCGRPLMLSLTSSTWVEREFTPDRLAAAGVQIALFPLQPLYAGVSAMMDLLSQLQQSRYAPAVDTKQLSHHDFVRFIGFPEIEELQRKYLPSPEQMLDAR